MKGKKKTSWIFSIVQQNPNGDYSLFDDKGEPIISGVYIFSNGNLSSEQKKALSCCKVHPEAGFLNMPDACEQNLGAWIDKVRKAWLERGVLPDIWNKTLKEYDDYCESIKGTYAFGRICFYSSPKSRSDIAKSAASLDKWLQNQITEESH